MALVICDLDSKTLADNIKKNSNFILYFAPDELVIDCYLEVFNDYFPKVLGNIIFEYFRPVMVFDVSIKKIFDIAYEVIGNCISDDSILPLKKFELAYVTCNSLKVSTSNMTTIWFGDIIKWFENIHL